jgi:hypothetical protein
MRGCAMEPTPQFVARCGRVARLIANPLDGLRRQAILATCFRSCRKGEVDAQPTKSKAHNGPSVNLAPV